MPRQRLAQTVPDELRQEWGWNIYLCRRAAGYLTQHALAVKIGLTSAAVSYWESGKSAPRELQRLQLAELFNLDVDELFPLDTSDLGAA